MIAAAILLTAFPAAWTFAAVAPLADFLAAYFLGIPVPRAVVAAVWAFLALGAALILAVVLPAWWLPLPAAGNVAAAAAWWRAGQRVTGGARA